MAIRIRDTWRKTIKANAHLLPAAETLHLIVLGISAHEWLHAIPALITAVMTAMAWRFGSDA